MTPHYWFGVFSIANFFRHTSHPFKGNPTDGIDSVSCKHGAGNNLIQNDEIASPLRCMDELKDEMNVSSMFIAKQLGDRFTKSFSQKLPGNHFNFAKPAGTVRQHYGEIQWQVRSS